MEELVYQFLPWTVPETFLHLQLCKAEDIQISNNYASNVCVISRATLQFLSESAVQLNIPILQMRKPVFEGVKWLTQILMASTWQSRESNPGLLNPALVFPQHISFILAIIQHITADIFVFSKSWGKMVNILCPWWHNYYHRVTIGVKSFLMLLL